MTCTRNAFCVLLFSLLLVDPALGRHAIPARRLDARAISQCAAEIRNPAVVLFLSIQPGYEDFPLLTRYRFVDGAQVVVGYVTNGESTPSDAGDLAPVTVAGRRKEEANDACGLVGATPFFMNLVDPGIVPEQDRLLRFWNADTLRSRLVREILHYRPDMIVVGGDKRAGEINSTRARMLESEVLRAVRVAGGEERGPDSTAPFRWKVARILAERPSREASSSTRPAALDSAKAMAALYASMRLQFASQSPQRSPHYDVLFPSKGKVSSTRLEELPVYGTVTRRFAKTIRALVGTSKRPVKFPSIKGVHRTIDSLDVLLGRERMSITPGDLRILATWKNLLEQLRCLLLGVSIEYTVDDLNVTRSQIAFLHFNAISPGDDSVTTRIFFPNARNHVWGINESPESQFPLSSGREFRIITPYDLDYAYPVSLFGLDKTSLTTRFSFIVFHRERSSDGDYIFRKEIPFRAHPRRSLEILTPVVRAFEGQSLLVRMVNSNRDAFAGELMVKDSLVSPVTAKVTLKKRDEVRIDTLHITPRGSLPEGDYPLALTLSGAGDFPFIARSFPAEVPAGAQIGLITGVPGGPIATALDRLGAHWRSYDRLSSETGWDSCNVLVIDRDALAGINAAKTSGASLGAWIRRGGHLVVMSPTSAGGLPDGLVPATFVPGPPVAAWGELEFDTSSAVMTAPNPIRQTDWDGWVVSRAQSHVQIESAAKAQIIVRSGATQLPLMADFGLGDGKVTLVALDLAPQLMNVHPGAHRILANVLRPVVPGAGER